MSPLLALVVAFVIIVLLIGIATIVAVKLGLLRPAKPCQVSSGDDATISYKKRDYVLTPAERAFFAALRDAVPHAMPGVCASVFPSVRLAEILAVDAPKGANRSAWQRGFNRISSKQVDFVVCESSTTRPLLIIELDDPSHEAQARKDRDDLVDKACASAGLPILHVVAATTYNSAVLARQIAEKRPKS